jgi:hypothetical protein
VGIGTTSPAYALDVKPANADIANFETTVVNGASKIYVGSYGTQTRVDLGATYAGYGHVGTSNNYPFVLRINSTEKMRIATDGNVGIGSTNPSQKLTINGSSSNSLSITGSAGAQYLLMGNQDSGGVNNPAMIQAANGAFYFGGGNSWSGNGGTFSSSMVISDAGNVGIGTTSPSQKLEVNGNVKITSGDLMFNASGMSTNVIDNYGGDVNGIGIAIGSGAATIVGSGESASVASANLAATTESLWLVSDAPTTSEAIRFITSLQGGWASRVDAMTILGNGKVGIGTTTPNSLLHVVSPYPRTNTSENILSLQTTNDADYRIGLKTSFIGGVNSSNRTTVLQSGGYDISAASFGNGGEKLALNPNGGNVGINTTTPTQTLNVIGSANITGSMIIGNSNITTLSNGDVNVW